jgi:hypothetical protein
MENQRKQWGEMVDDQTAKQIAKPLKKGKKKKSPVLECRKIVLVFLVLLL